MRGKSAGLWMAPRSSARSPHVWLLLRPPASSASVTLIPAFQQMYNACENFMSHYAPPTPPAVGGSGTTGVEQAVRLAERPVVVCHAWHACWRPGCVATAPTKRTVGDANVAATVL